MEPIRDFSWMKQMLTGKIREQFTYAGFRVVGIELPPTEKSKNPYHYRFLFFPENSQKPVLSLNLESSILGSFCFTEHTGPSHMNLGHSDQTLSYEAFREWALDRAARVLH